MKINLTRIYGISILLIVMVTTFTLYYYATINGLGISPDSITYIDTASSLLEGKGFFVGKSPMTHYPPVYPIILAISGIFNPDIVRSAHVTHALIYFMNASLFGIIIFLSTSRNLLAMILGLLMFFSSKSILYIHSYAWSESPFIMFILISFLLLFLFLTRQRIIYLILASTSIGLAIATRYVGIALIPTIIILILLINKPVITRIKWAFTSLIIILVPILSWIIRNFIVAQTATNRSIIFHPFSIEKIKSLLLTLHGFFLPTSGLGIINVLELLLLSVIFSYMTLLQKG